MSIIINKNQIEEFQEDIKLIISLYAKESNHCISKSTLSDSITKILSNDPLFEKSKIPILMDMIIDLI